MALGVFTSASVVPRWVQHEADVSNLGDLLLYSLDDLEQIAADKGGIRQLRDKKWRKVYRASAPGNCSHGANCGLPDARLVCLLNTALPHGTVPASPRAC
jgi:hypothetical protein